MTTTSDVLIVGGGLAGLTVARAAAKRGLTVTVLDAPRAGAASRAAAGMLAPTAEALPPHIAAAALAARALYPEYLTALREDVGIDVALDRSGLIQLADETSAGAGRPAGTAGWLDQRALADLEPAFAHHVGAWLHPDGGAVDNVALMTALSRAVDQTPTIECLVADVLSIDPARVSALTRTRGRFTAAALVLANGAWAGTLSGLPATLPVRPVRGQLLRLAAAPIRHVTYGAGGYLVPRGDAPQDATSNGGSLLVGATSEEAGFENETSLAGLASLRAIATRAIPSLSRALVADHWAGLRPMSPDGLPILGPDSRIPALFYAAGYSRHGILFAPWAADELAKLLTSEPAPALSAFGVDRFSEFG